MKDDFCIIDFIKAEPILRNIYSDISTLDFNIFDLKKETNGNELFFMVHYLMTIENFYEKLSIDPEVYKRYALGIQSHYNDVTYHNKTHAADVTQTAYYFLKACSLSVKMQLSNLEMFSVLTATAIHDTDHPGFNNVFLINTKNKMALRYNDKSVLENHHVALAFDIMHHSENMRILDSFTDENYKRSRNLIIDLVLGTDMAKHFEELNSLT